jgi:hypothetical protein
MEWQTRALPVHGTLPPQDAFQAGDSAVIMVFPRRTVLSIDGTNKKICYEPGVHNVPARLADHWYLKAHGATRHEMPQQPAGEVLEAAEEPETEDSRSADNRRGRRRG